MGVRESGAGTLTSACLCRTGRLIKQRRHEAINSSCLSLQLSDLSFSPPFCPALHLCHFSLNTLYVTTFAAKCPSFSHTPPLLLPPTEYLLISSPPSLFYSLSSYPFPPPPQSCVLLAPPSLRFVSSPQPPSFSTSPSLARLPSLSLHLFWESPCHISLWRSLCL